MVNDQCMICGKTIESSEGWLYFVEDGRYICEECKKMAVIPKGTLRIEKGSSSRVHNPFMSYSIVDIMNVTV